MLFAASDFVARLVATLEGAGALTGGYALWITLSLLALALLQLALIGLYSPHRQTVGSLGWVGFFLASMGIAFAFFIVLVYAASASPLTPDDPKLLKGGPPSMIVLYFPLFSAGWVLLGAAFLRIPFYPHWAVLLLAAGAVLALHPNPFTTVIFSAGIVVLGLALVMGDPRPTCDPDDTISLAAARKAASRALRAVTVSPQPTSSLAGALACASRSWPRRLATGREPCSRSRRPRRRKHSAS